MNTMNAAGLELVKRFEGWRGRAYRDAVGVWTIGYGHTSMAGPPRVTPGLRITRAEGEAILRRDLRRYERVVRDAVRVPLNDNQYAALVSFCYNVGPASFRRSSALRYLNRGLYDQVPRRLALWNRAGGRVLRGLVRRRKAEGELFATPIDEVEAQGDIARAAAARGRVAPDTGKPVLRSRSAWAAAGLGALSLGEVSLREVLPGGVSEASGLLRSLVENLSALSQASGLPLAVLLPGAVAVGLAGWIIYDRWWKSVHEGV